MATTAFTAKKAEEVGVKRFVEVSTAFVYKSQAKQPATEGAELQPWTLQAKYKLEVMKADSARICTNGIDGSLSVWYVRFSVVLGCFRRKKRFDSLPI